MKKELTAEQIEARKAAKRARRNARKARNAGLVNSPAADLTKLGYQIVRELQVGLQRYERDEQGTTTFSDWDAKDLARALNIAPRAVNGALPQLIANGYVETNFVEVNGGGFQAIYLTQKAWDIH